MPNLPNLPNLPITQPAASLETTRPVVPAGVAVESPAVTSVARKRRPIVKATSAGRATKPAKVSLAIKTVEPIRPAKPVKRAKPVKPVTPMKPTQPAAPARAAAAPAAATEPGKPARIKEKLVRDSFTMPRADFALIQQLKDRMLARHRHTRKSELLRAGLQALAALGDAPLRRLLDGLPALKAGRPRKAG